MKITLGKKLSNEENLIVSDISSKCGIQFDTARLLFYRGVDSADKAKEFLHPSKTHFNNPFLFKDMKAVTERIKQAKENSETVLIYGDYDADGICATTVLYFCLKEYGINAIYTIPEREEGYGVNLGRIEGICSENIVDLIITVDCGISEHDNIEELKDLGIDVIVTDHHEPPEVLPNCLTINPKLKDSGYPFGGLCGAGVAYKVGYALIGEKADSYLDFVALATVADSMDLVKENRDLVYEGLKIMNTNKLRSCFKYLINDNNRQMTAQSLVFSIAPRINAGGRMGDALSALKLFVSKDENEIYDLSVKLNEYNVSRQAFCDTIYKQAKESIIKNKLYYDSVIMIGDPKWATGFTGIVAARLVEEYGRPVIVFAGYDDDLKGSARSIEGVNIFEAISSASDLLRCFGGHSQAAGVTVSKENFEKFKRAVCDYVNEKYKDYDFEKEIVADWEVVTPISLSFASEMEKLEPFGVGNRKPSFITKVNRVYSKPIKSLSPHYSFSTDVIDMLDFNGVNDVFDLSLPIDKFVLFEVSLSTFRDKTSIKGFVKKVIPDYSNFDALDLFIFRNNLLNLANQNTYSFNKIQKENVKIENGFGKLYLISDEKNISLYDGLSNLPKYLFKSDLTNAKNCLIVSPSAVFENYNEYIYLDKPTNLLSSYNNYVCEDVCGFNAFKDLSTDRNDFSKVFEILCKFVNKTFVNSVDFVLNNDIDVSDKLFIFATEVFFELGFFSINGEYLVRNYSSKNPLSNSTIYNKICLIKES